MLAAPVLYGMYQAGGTLMAIWLGICSLAGIALSVVGPLFIARKLMLVCFIAGAPGRTRIPAAGRPLKQGLSRFNSSADRDWRARQDSNLRPQA